MSNEGVWYTTLGFTGEQNTHTLMLRNCAIVIYRNLKSRQTNHFVNCAVVMTANTLNHLSVIMNIYLLNAVLPIFKLHLLDSVSSSFLLMSQESKDRPIVFPLFFL